MSTYVELIIGDLPGFDGASNKLITVKGQLDESNVDEEAKKIYQILDAAPEGFNLILNFADLEYLNSKAIGYLTDWYTRLSDRQGKIIIVQARENILDILQVVGLTQLIETFVSMDEARLALNHGSLGAQKPVPAVTLAGVTENSPNMPTGSVQIASAPAPTAPAPTPTAATPATMTISTAVENPAPSASAQQPSVTPQQQSSSSGAEGGGLFPNLQPPAAS